MADTTPVTTTKANVASGIAGVGAAIVTLLLFWAGPSIGLAAPDQAEAASAFTVVVTTLVTAAATAIPTWIGAYFATNKPKGDAPMGGGLNAHWLATLGAAGLLLLMGGLAGCEKNPDTGANRTTGERIAVGLDYFLAAATILDAVTGDPDEPGVMPEMLGEMLGKIDRGITVYCALDPASQDVMIADIDPAILAVAVRHRGGADGNVCSEG